MFRDECHSPNLTIPCNFFQRGASKHTILNLEDFPMEMIIDFPGGLKVDAHFRGHTFKTDQPPADTAPMPFELFLASIGTCAGIYVLGFCRQRNLPTEGIRIIQRNYPNMMTGLMDKIDLEIQVPPTFPEQYHAALVRSAELCKVKKTLENPPAFEVTTKVMQPA
jgi:ribosomal protein S12 methylthiotransferase accessory factor